MFLPRAKFVFIAYRRTGDERIQVFSEPYRRVDNLSIGAAGRLNHLDPIANSA
jgi:hypothetical protein